MILERILSYNDISGIIARLFFMEKNKSKVAISSQITETIPSVVVAAPPPSPVEKKFKNVDNENLFATVSKKVVSFFFDFLETIVVALSIFVVVYLFLFQPHEIKGNSMEPNYHNDEYILTDKVSYRFREPDRGDVIIFRAPTNPDVDYIKRIIALPGEQVKIQNGQVYVNNQPLAEGYVEGTTPLLPASTMQEGVPIVVADGELFVMGDNRAHSSDSREFGPIDMKSVIGRAFLRYWPPQQFAILSQARYAGNL